MMIMIRVVSPRTLRKQFAVKIDLKMLPKEPRAAWVPEYFTPQSCNITSINPASFLSRPSAPNS